MLGGEGRMRLVVAMSLGLGSIDWIVLCNTDVLLES